MTKIERIERERLRFASRKRLHEHRLGRLAAERDWLYLGVFVLLGAGVLGATVSAFELVDIRGAYLCFVAALAVRAEWRRAYRETFAELEDYAAFMRAQLDEGRP